MIRDKAEITFFVRESEPHAQVTIVGRDLVHVKTLDDDVALEEDKPVTYIWDATTDEGEPAPVGRYRLRVVLPSSGPRHGLPEADRPHSRRRRTRTTRRLRTTADGVGARADRAADRLRRGGRRDPRPARPLAAGRAGGRARRRTGAGARRRLGRARVWSDLRDSPATDRRGRSWRSRSAWPSARSSCAASSGPSRCSCSPRSALRLPVRIGGETSNLLIPLYLVIASSSSPRWSACDRRDRRRGAARRRLAAPRARRRHSSSTRSRPPTATTSRTRSRTPGSSSSPSRSCSASSPRFAGTARNLRAVGHRDRGRGRRDRGGRDRPVRDPGPDPEQGAPRLEPDQAVLPGQLRLLRPERAWPLHGPGDRSPWEPRSRGRGAGARRCGRSPPGLADAGRAGAQLLAHERRRPARRPRRAGVDSLRAARRDRVPASRSCSPASCSSSPGALDRPDIGPYRGFDEETSGRGALLEGGFDLIEDEPIARLGLGVVRTRLLRPDPEDPRPPPRTRSRSMSRPNRGCRA